MENRYANVNVTIRDHIIQPFGDLCQPSAIGMTMGVVLGQDSDDRI